jgi:hypothetical protein
MISQTYVTNKETFEDMDCHQSMENYGTPFVAHNGSGAQAEFQEGVASTRLYINATCQCPHLKLPARVTVGLF